MDHVDEEYEGNSLWAAPEVFQQCETDEPIIGSKADIWSLGESIEPPSVSWRRHQCVLCVAANTFYSLAFMVC